MARTTLHATAVAIDGRGVLIVGPSGAGKSDLALRLIDRGAALIADDAVVLTVAEHRLIATAVAPATAGQLLVAGIGVVTVPAVDRVALALAIDLATPAAASALPRIGHLTVLEQWALPLLSLDATTASAPLKVALALDRWGL